MSEAVVRAGVVISHLLRQELEKKKYKKKRSWISRREKYGALQYITKRIKTRRRLVIGERATLIAQCRYTLTHARLCLPTTSE